MRNVFLLIALLCLCSCFNRSKYTDWEEFELNGSVKSIKEMSYKAEQKLGEITKGEKGRTDGERNYERKFNQQGFLIEGEYYYEDVNLDYRVVSEIGKDGSPISRSFYSPYGDLTSKVSFKYASNGKYAELKIGRASCRERVLRLV